MSQLPYLVIAKTLKPTCRKHHVASQTFNLTPPKTASGSSTPITYLLQPLRYQDVLRVNAADQMYPPSVDAWVKGKTPGIT